MTENVGAILGVEVLAAAQGCDFHAPLKSSHDLEACARRPFALVCLVSTTTAIIYPDLKAATNLVREGALVAGLETALPSITGAIP